MWNVVGNRVAGADRGSERHGARAGRHHRRELLRRVRSGRSSACGTATATGDTATFTAAEIFPGLALSPHEGMTVTVGIPKGAVVPEPKPILEERFTWRRRSA